MDRASRSRRLPHVAVLRPLAARRGARCRGTRTGVSGAISIAGAPRSPTTPTPSRRWSPTPTAASFVESVMTSADRLRPATNPRFAVGDAVVVRRWRDAANHHRCPRYVRGVTGRVESICGDEPVPGHESTDIAPLYTVAFASTDLWGAGRGTTVHRARRPQRAVPGGRRVSDHDHSHSHHETPGSRRPRSEFELRTMALEAALVEAGRVSTDAIDTFVDYMEHRLGPHHGARVVARAWVDPEFKAAPAHRRHGGDGRARDRRRRGRQRAGRREHRRRCTTWSCARCARATRGHCSGSRRSGTRASPTGPAPSPNRGPCCASSAPSSPTTSRSACGTPARRSATSSSPPDPPARDSLTEDELAALVTRDGMVGTAQV